MLHYQWDQQDSASISIITSPVMPLGLLLSKMDEVELALGLHSILSVLSFMHETVCRRFINS